MNLYNYTGAARCKCCVDKWKGVLIREGQLVWESPECFEHFYDAHKRANTAKNAYFNEMIAKGAAAAAALARRSYGGRN